MVYADIVIDITLEKLDRTFQYAVPPEMVDSVRIGSEVVIPFGNGGRTLKGVVLGLSQEAKIDPNRIKEILSVETSDIPVESQLIELAGWIAEHFGSTMKQALKTVLPSKTKAKAKEKKIVSLAVSKADGEALLTDLLSKKRHSVARERLLSELLETEEIPWDVITGKLNIGSAIIRDLEKRGVVQVSSQRDFRNPLGDLTGTKKHITLNEEQMACVNQVRSDWAKGIHKTYLLYGVTGSGKTEVYMELIHDTLERGQEAIVLIPEIALTYQTVMRFYQHFGNQVAIMNSRLTPGERMDQLDRAKNGDCKIMIGPRSALFTPFPHLGLIIVDEEHESSYKSEQAPRYHAREVAVKRGELSHASVILGSATPSVESFELAHNGTYGLLEMKHRVAERELPKCEIVDLREEMRLGNRTMLSRRLQELIQDRLDRQEQTMLFLNRRGLMGFVSCRACGKSLKCPHCDVALSLHRDGRLHCHYCGYTEPKPRLCPHCGSNYIGGMKAGTEKVEETVHKLFPTARVLRMDADTTKGKEGHREILEKFSNREADILIGTQMIVKGHDFPYVTLMGIIAADLSLNSSDFRGSERTFQLITQAAGRAGRGEIPGNVVIQTYQPENYSIVTAKDQNYEAFYQQEISYRKLMSYPPEGHLLMILMTSEKLSHVTEEARILADYLKETLAQTLDKDTSLRNMTQVLGPEDARIAKIQDVYRKTIYLKDRDYEKLVSAKNLAADYVQTKQKYHDVYVWFDFDPM